MTAPDPHFFAAMQSRGRQLLASRLARVVKRAGDDECWNFTGADTGTGYGRIYISGYYFRVHRLAWALHHWEDPADKVVCHTCDNRRCCNPAHLWLGTVAENLADMVRKGRRVEQVGKRNRKRGPKVTAEAAKQIKSDRRPKRVVAKAYGISIAHVGRIRAGKAWTKDFRGRSTFPSGGKPARGEDHPGARLTAEQVLTIFLDPRPAAQIAADYPISRGTVGYIKRRQTWRHVTALAIPRSSIAETTHSGDLDRG